ncbi:360_t:CDS:2, partial [Gigaspora margarita]
MKKKFNKYWNVVLDHVIIAHVLDPRYKLDHLKATLIEVGKYSMNNAELYIDDIQQKVISNRIKYTTGSNVKETLNVKEPSNVENVELVLIILYSIEYELELYKNEPLEDRMAHDYLSIQPSCIFSLRAFLRAGFTLTSDKVNL